MLVLDQKYCLLISGSLILITDTKDTFLCVSLLKEWRVNCVCNQQVLEGVEPYTCLNNLTRIAFVILNKL